MKNYLFLYRTDYEAFAEASPEEMQARTQLWMDWVGNIAAQNKLADRGSSLAVNGKVVKASGLITDGPFTEIKESILGYSIVKAASYQEATDLTKGCPIFLSGGNVEVREVNGM